MANETQYDERRAAAIDMAPPKCHQRKLSLSSIKRTGCLYRHPQTPAAGVLAPAGRNWLGEMNHLTASTSAHSTLRGM
ncbi:hypothetical protein KCP73_08070 [Salmonella enterica subsp. enterica]|nr:hypothetical protein KCP73_08070 [Salmonella enterica subsp. enterica]